jgi:hypothetical protein
VPATTAPTTTVAHGALPATGSDSSGLVRLAVVLTALGLTAIAVTATRRRPRTN